ncbi:MAG TPA: polysaccharide biosynthesis tyrosine autokinase, partial [Candidatus Polarisedimenticolaceae bacterium]|nr:polysaccharide biosynthesis tyrosine autokinase [Candidatus Polarisedimenticolaceae bacterium]
VLALLRGLLPRRGVRVEQDPLDLAAARLQGGLQIAPVRNSHLVQVGARGPDPLAAAAVANAVAEAYVEFNIETQYSTSDQAREFLVNQIGTLKREINEIEQRLQDYGEAKNIVTIDDASNITIQALKDISEKRTEAQTTLAHAQAEWDAVQHARPEALPEVLASQLIGRLREEYASYEAEFAEKSRRFKQDWPGMQTLQSKLDGARERLELETQRIAEQVRATSEGAYLRARAEVERLSALLGSHEADAQRLKRDAVEFANLRSEVLKKRETLDALIRRQNEMALSTRLKDLDSTSTNIRIVERARPPAAPFRPDTALNLVLGLLFGLGAGVAAAFLLDYLDNTVGSATELERLAELPVLAVIPRHLGAGVSGRRRRTHLGPAESVDLVAHHAGRARATEAYRELRTSLLLSHPGGAPRQIMVTSSLPEEGKTATAINLAVVLAQLGKRVVLVDTDLRRPRLHKALDTGHAAGVSTYLSGQQDDPLPLVVRTEVPHLELLPSGPIPPNPSELLNSPRFAELGRALLAGGFDHVLYDSPPVLSVADPVIIASIVDSRLLVVRAGRTPRQSIRLAAAKLKQSGVPPIGVVLNDLDRSAAGSGYYDYGYGGYDIEEAPAAESEPRPRIRAGA